MNISTNGTYGKPEVTFVNSAVCLKQTIFAESLRSASLTSSPLNEGRV